MNAQLSAYPWPWNFVAYSILGIGWLATVIFVVWYVRTEPWYNSEVGKHLVSFSCSVGAFFTLYLILAIFPDMPGKGIVRLVLLVALVANCVWRLVIFAKHRTKHKPSDR